MNAVLSFWKRPQQYQAIGLFVFLAIPAILFYIFIGQIWLAASFLVAMALVVSFFRMTDSTVGNAGGAENWRLFSLCLAVGFISTTIGGEGRLFPATADWVVRDSVLHDLVSRGWPFVYRLDGVDWMLRAPIGMFLIPALVGKLLGLYAANIALWAQNSFVIGIIFWTICKSSSFSRSVVVLVVLCLFSGWDVVGALVVSGIHDIVLHTPLPIPADIGWWSGLFQYSSTMTLIFWVPNHALAGWLFVALLLLWDRGEIRISALMIGALLATLWSPFALMGAMPFLLKAGVEALWQRRVAISDFGLPIIVAALSIPFIIYLASDTSGVPKGFTAETGAASGFGIIYFIFELFEVFPFILFNLLRRSRGIAFSDSTYFLALLTLLMIPVYKIGGENDFVMRASIPALAVMGITTGHTVFDILCDRKPLPLIAAAVLVSLSAFTGFDQIWHIMILPNRGISTCNFVQAWRQDIPGLVNTSTMAPYLANESNVKKWLRPDKPEIYVTSAITGPCADQRL